MLDVPSKTGICTCSHVQDDIPAHPQQGGPKFPTATKNKHVVGVVQMDLVDARPNPLACSPRVHQLAVWPDGSVTNMTVRLAC